METGGGPESNEGPSQEVVSLNPSASSNGGGGGGGGYIQTEISLFLPLRTSSLLWFLSNKRT